MENGCTKGVYPVQLVDGCGLVLERGGAEKIFWYSDWKEKCVQS